jgi:hypothetical protein
MGEEDQGAPEGLSTRQMGRGFSIEAHMASMAAPVAVVMMQVQVNKHYLRGAVGPVHQVDEVRQYSPLGGAGR